MPAESRNQRIASAIALHHPGKLYKRNRGLLKMTPEELRDYASSKGSVSISDMYKGTKKKKR